MTNKVLLSLLVFLWGIQNAYAWTVELTQDELQTRVNRMVPLEKNQLVFTLLVSAIDVELKEGSDRVGLIGKMEIKSPHFSTGKGMAYIEGKPVYQPADGAFYFTDAQVKDVRFENVPDKYRAVIGKLFEIAIRDRLAETPIYKLDKAKTKQQIARTLLKSVKVVDRKLVLELGLF